MEMTGIKNVTLTQNDSMQQKMYILSTLANKSATRDLLKELKTDL